VLATAHKPWCGPTRAGSSSRDADVNDTDIALLRRCIELARAARDAGNAPFGSILVSRDGVVAAELMNATGSGDVTAHPELALAAWASPHMTDGERATATLYTSCESCAMCATAQFWAGIGRLVFALSSEQLGEILPVHVAHLRLSSRDVFARGDVPIEVDGPCEELVADALAVFDGFWTEPMS